ncbi:hypothetical protein [Pyxidicoccus xibeiensis]|uniref:hypothetical protein n=1 Tax=Pyxidicoccus xibeiensis TaxID=2906759 RepID=UPI0020A6E32B|nr:hypothetical protein [Pyxidicoccus xibeiensis]MCP3136459.1 hypothetical protein [Pyxidicoccus xibeiensis]
MKRVAAVAVLAMALGGCTASKMEQRHGCWVRQVRTFPSTVKEEIGPCARPTPVWSEDRLTRLVQECVMHADYRWQSSALVAWNRGEPLPEREPEEKVLGACMARAETVLNAEKSSVEQQLSEVSKERDALKASAEKEREEYLASLAKERDQYQTSIEKVRTQHDASMERARDQMHESNNRLAEVLGEAAKKPAPSAIATATSTSTSEGKANTQSDSLAQGDSRSRGDSTSRGDSATQGTPASRGPKVAKPTSGAPLPMCPLPSQAKRVHASTAGKQDATGTPETAACSSPEPGESTPAVQSVLATPLPQTAKAPTPPGTEAPAAAE